jgi:hypothetical protein
MMHMIGLGCTVVALTFFVVRRSMRGFFCEWEHPQTGACAFATGYHWPSTEMDFARDIREFYFTSCIA